MTSVGDFIFSRLSASEDLSILVGDRIYPVKLPDNCSLPAISFQLVIGTPDEALDGPTGLHSDIYTIDSWSETQPEANAIANVVRQLLHGHSQIIDSTLTIKGIIEWSTNELYDSESETFHLSSSCRIWYSV
jgi:hypothetical protein